MDLKIKCATRMQGERRPSLLNATKCKALFERSCKTRLKRIIKVRVLIISKARQITKKNTVRIISCALQARQMLAKMIQRSPLLYDLRTCEANGFELCGRACVRYEIEVVVQFSPAV